MFSTLGSFSAVYFTLAAIVFVLILFEKHLIALEDNFKAKRAVTKKSIKNNKSIKNTPKSKSNNTRRNSASSVRKIPGSAA